MKQTKRVFVSRIGTLSLLLGYVGVAPSAHAAVDYEWLLTSPKGAVSVTASTELGGQPAISSVNNAGMSSTSYPTDLHSTNTGDMWSTAANDAAPSIQYDLGATYPLGKMLVWNYAAFVSGWGSFSGRGIRDCMISTSEDGTTWQTLTGPGAGGKFTLAKAGATNTPGSATNQDGGLGAIDFKGRPARYVRIAPLTTATGNWGGAAGETDKYYALSEVRIYRHGASVTATANIPARVAAWSSQSNGSQGNTTNNANMSDAGSGTYTASATVGTSNYWITAGSDPKPYIIYDLGGTYPLSSMAVWNLNLNFFGSWTTSGIKNCSIYYSVGNPGIANLGEWTKLGTTWTFTQASGAPGQAKTDSVNFNNALAHYVMIVPNAAVGDGNYGGGYYGLSQVRFFAGNGHVAEPIPHWNALMGQRSTTASTYLWGDGGYSVKYTPSGGGTKALFVVDDPGYGTWNSTTYAPTWTGGANNGYGIFTAPASPTLTPALSSFAMDATSSHAIVPSSGTWPNQFFWIQGGYYESSSSSIYLAALRNEAGSLNPKGFNVIKLPVDSVGTPNWAAANTLANQYDTGFFFFNAADTTQTVGFPMQLTKLPDGFVYAYGWKGSGPNIGLIVGRFAPADVNNKTAWRFWNGSAWVTDFKASATILAGGAKSGTWGSVTQNPGWDSDPAKKYMFVTAPVPFGPDAVSIAYAPNPWGPFTGQFRLFVPQEGGPFVEGDPQAFPGDIWIAASHHPELSSPGEAIITVNMHGDHQNATEGHPRFYRVRKL